MDLKILQIAADTKNNKEIKNFTHKSKYKSQLCGDEIEISLVVKNHKILDMAYQCKSCVYCEASASLLSKKVKNLNIKTIKKEFRNLKNISRNKEFKIPKKFTDFKKLFNSDNFNRLNCIFLPFDAVIKALKL